MVALAPGCRFKLEIENGWIWKIVRAQPRQQPAQPEPGWLLP
eukprot:COSAG05_NODE_16793_length_338_cov_1.497908_1_plen_41_part_01